MASTCAGPKERGGSSSALADGGEDPSNAASARPGAEHGSSTSGWQARTRGEKEPHIEAKHAFAQPEPLLVGSARCRNQLFEVVR